MLKKVLVVFGVMWLAFTVGQAQAVSILMEENFGENDCSGFFGQGFGSCQVVGDVTLSPVIAKFGADGEADEFNTDQYPTIDGTEWSFTPDPLSGSSGSWAYTPDDPEDPGIRYWAAKGGNDFKLFWVVEDSATQAGGACEGHVGDDGELDGACLDEALVQFSGDWATPSGADLSHLTFYDTERTTTVPEPGTLLLLGTALGGLWFVRRKSAA